jgi:hypothetical protein
MELKVNEVIIPERIDFNFEELKTELSEQVEKYRNLVYTDDQIKECKADKASLNRLKKALNDERIRRKKEYLKPFEEFEGKVNEIIKIIDEPLQLIDKQVKEFEEKKKADKRIEIGAFWETTEHPEWLTLARIFDERWLNATYTMKQIQADITGWINRVNSELETLEQLDSFSFEAIDVYKRSLDMNQAIAEGKRLADIQKRKEEAQKRAEEEARRKAELLETQKKIEEETRWEEMQKAGSELAEGFSEGLKEETGEIDAKAEKAEGTAQNGAMWINFSALLTVDQALKLKQFFEENQIQFKKI